jgi:hypothetical protein
MRTINAAILAVYKTKTAFLAATGARSVAGGTFYSFGWGRLEIAALTRNSNKVV